MRQIGNISRWAARLACALGGVGLAVGACPAARAQDVWFGAVPNITTPHGIDTDADYPSLFSEPSAWPNGLARIKTFIFTRKYIQVAADDVLGQQLAFLKAHGIAVAVAMGVVEANGCGQGIEGMVFGNNTNRNVALKIQRLGGEMAYLVADEPYTFGHKSRQPGACRYTVAEVAASFARQVGYVQQVFPSVRVVDNEASSYLKDFVEVALWVDTLKTLLAPLHPVMGLDVQWDHAVWFTWAQPFVDLLEQHGMRYSIIYHGIGHYKVDADWLYRAQQFALNWEATVTTHPRYVVIQSWNPAPSHSLPETDPTALTSLLLSYCDQITKLVRTCNFLHGARDDHPRPAVTVK